MVIEVKEKGALSDRVKRLKEGVLQATPRISTSRLKFLKESYKETEGQSTVLRRAKFFDKFLRGTPISIDENLIVGALTQWVCGVEVYPEYSSIWMKEESSYSSMMGPIEATKEDMKLLSEAADYWKDKCVNFMSRQTFFEKYVIDWGDIRASGVSTDTTVLPLGRMNIDYGKALNKGLNGVIAEAKTELEKLPLFAEAQKARDFLNSVIISCGAVIAFARRYAELAREMARNEMDIKRREELERISDICDWVPANPARDFRDAIQSFWFVHIAMQLEHLSPGNTPGRWALYTYPFYKKDKEAGKITAEDAIELLQLLYINFTAINRILDKRQYQEDAGVMFQNITIGGLTAEGEDATNELDYLLLEAQKRIRMPQPTLSVLYHDKLAPELLIKAAEVVRTGIGMPAFFNYNIGVQRLLSHGSSLEDARNHCIIGCVETGWSHACSAFYGGFLNMPKMLELALNNGIDPLTGKQLGIQTGKAEDFSSYEALEGAILKQLQYFMRLWREFYKVGSARYAEIVPYTFTSALVDDCIKRGRNMEDGGARYNMKGGGPVGIINMADSLAAVKKLVYEEKQLTMKQLLEALQANFEGKHDVLQMLLKCPKYGNDDDYVDRIAQKWYRIFYDEHEKFTDHLDKRTKPYALSITTHGPLGRLTGALPSGRKAGEPLADGTVSAVAGMDRKGPTALMRSATKVLDTTMYASNLLNAKFHPSVLKDVDGLRKMIHLVKTYMDLGGHHVQFNVVSIDTLRDAQLHPEKYKDLIVRVAGFSAFYIHLDPVVQNEIIKRTELDLN